ncbi:MAG: dihydrofolate reductase [Polyangiaceae bacterium]|nr:dihydrofolate reductase [Polyangiaceae bacterium]
MSDAAPRLTRASFEVVAACDEGRGLGYRGELPWRAPGDVAFFKALTTQVPRVGIENAIVMGRKTWDTVPPRFRPLRGRLNVVVTRDRALPLPDGVLRAGGLETALELLAAPETADSLHRVFVIGGGEIYAQAVRLPECRRVHLTRIFARFPCDAFFPELGPEYGLFSRSGEQKDEGLRYVFECWERRA